MSRIITLKLNTNLSIKLTNLIQITLTRRLHVAPSQKPNTQLIVYGTISLNRIYLKRIINNNMILLGKITIFFYNRDFFNKILNLF
jgi:hypothetical protein